MRILMVHDDRIYEPMEFMGRTQHESCDLCALHGDPCADLNGKDGDFCDNIQVAAKLNTISFKEII